MKHKTLKGIILIFTLLFGLNSVSASEMAFEFGKKASVTPLARHVTTTTVSYDSPSDFFTELLVEIMTGVWLVNNITVSFQPYPYAAEGKYLMFGDFGASSNFEAAYESKDSSFEKNIEPSETVKTRVFRFAADTSLFWMDGFDIGNESRFEGYLFKFFGPVFENTLYCKNASLFGVNGNDAGNLRLGGELALIQTNMISAAFVIQWDHWYGSVKADGVNFGFIVRSYPIKPLLLEWRPQFHCLTENAQDLFMFESILEVGFMVWRNFEVFASWRHIDTRQYKSWFNNTFYNGISAGIRVHF